MKVLILDIGSIGIKYVPTSNDIILQFIHSKRRKM